ncbi:MAG: PASTA domain-containing protein [Actinomycetota bacterium]
MSSSESERRTADRLGGEPDSSERTNPLVGTTVADRYRVASVVSVGANTVICDAIDVTADRPITLKLVRPEHAATDDFRFKFEKLAELTHGLTHPNIASVLDWGQVTVGGEDTVYWTVDALGGGSLRDLLDRGRLLEPSQALVLGLEACRALDAAHQKGLFHTELTPAKMVFGADRRLRVVDFGMARLLAEPSWQERSSVPTHVARYASPEQAQGLPIDAHTDVYALSLVMIEAVTGEVPFAGESTVATLGNRVDRLMPVSADLGSLASILERAGRPEADDRFTAAEFGRALVDAAQSLPKPDPIPILATSMFDTTDTSEMRRPTDPTGGVARPDDGADDEADESADDDGLPPTEAIGAVGAAGAVAVAAGLDDDGLPPTEAIDAVETSIEPAVTDPTDAESLDTDPAETEPAETDSTDADSTEVPPWMVDERDPDDDLRLLVDDETGATESTGVGPTGTAEMPATAVAAAAAPAGVADELADGMADRRPALFDDDLGGDHTGEVFDGDPERKRRIGPIILLSIVFLAGLGALAYAGSLLLATKSFEVPVLAGTNVDEARNLIAGNDWNLTEQRERSDEFPEPDTVIRTEPGPGVEIDEGGDLTIVVSDGFEFRELPDSTGLPVADAVAQLDALRIGAQEAPERLFSETVAPGVVISWQVAGDASLTAGAQVLPGETVVLTVSMGPEPRTVPDLAGRTADEALAALNDLQLSPQRLDDVFSDDVEAGRVVSQEPAAGGELARGGTVSFAVSMGPDIIVFPDVVGLTYDEAVARLTDAGFVLGDVLGSTEGTVQQVTIADEPVEPGTEFRRGQPVDLVAL